MSASNQSSPTEQNGGVVVTITLHARPDQAETVLDLVTAAMRVSEDPAFLGGKVLTEIDDPTVVHMHQSWADRVGFDAHMAGAGGFDQLGDLLVSAPTTTVLQHHLTR
ncbi:MAG: antibiotic biosynthesis monooxygenase [Gordonia polyisoprenivorans]|nr:antibiotic biosynthesis monooxygenase [Gordonia polyisoprenivorans]